MSAIASILYLRLDANYDLVWDPNAELSDLQAVGQAIKTRLLLFEGEWWENLNDGTPMFQEIISQRASPGGQQIMALALTQRIAGTPYVSAVQNVSVTYNQVTRAFTYRCTVQTSFGTIPISFTPGMAANVSSGVIQL